MARFVVLDQSLTRVGGHHYEHAVQVLRAASRMGYEPVLATNRRFRQRRLLPAQWRVFPVFEDESFDCLNEYPLDMDGRVLAGSTSSGATGSGRWTLRGALHRLAERWRGARRRQRITRFAEACGVVDDAIRLRDADHVFLPTSSLFDLLGLARFIATARPLPNVMWHALFHYGFLQGRDPEYEGQATAVRKAGDQLAYLLQHIPADRLRFYGTTSRLAEQFNRLSLAPFDVLPFPVDSHAFQNPERGSADRLLRITCAGFLRREKGKGLASQFVRGVWESELAAGRMQLVLQTNRRQARRMLPPHAHVSLRFRSGLERRGTEPIVWLRHPLTRDAYIDMIRHSDMAVFLHDGRAYYTRCSGVLVEMLAGGVPVLVPAGSWLSDQVSEAIYEHLDALRETAPAIQILRGDELATGGVFHETDVWRPAAPADGVHEGSLLVCEAAVPAGAAALLVSFGWPREAVPGTYVELSMEDVTATASRPIVSVLGSRAGEKRVATLSGLAPATTRVRVRIGNAYGDVLPPVSDLTFHFLARPAGGERSYPAGKVGLVFADVSQLPMLIQNMREHYGHYLDSAGCFARQWRCRHDAQRIVERLLGGAAHGGDASPIRAVA